MSRMQIIPIHEQEFTCNGNEDGLTAHKFKAVKVYRLTVKAKQEEKVVCCAICPVHGTEVPVIIENLPDR